MCGAERDNTRYRGGRGAEQRTLQDDLKTGNIKTWGRGLKEGRGRGKGGRGRGRGRGEVGREG